VTSSDPFIIAARHIYSASLDEIRTALSGLSAEALNWRPDAPDTNSAAVLVAHCLLSTRDWICMAVNAPRPPRIRDEEFVTRFDSEANALAVLEAVGTETMGYLDAAEDPDWSAVRNDLVIEPGDPVPTRAFCLMHALEHLREHIGQLQLTRQLWDRSSIG
jgi:hypothetical protein